MWRSITAVLLVACGRLNFDSAEGPPVPGDGQPTDGAGDGPAVCVFGPWGNVQRLADIATPEFDLAPALHPDGSVLVFDTVVGGNRDLVIAKRNTNTGLFDTSMRIAELNTDDDDMQAGWSTDGTRLYFHRLGTGDEIMIAEYLGDAMFGPPIVDGTFPAGDNPSFTSGDKEVFYTSYSGDSDVAHARLNGDTWIVDNEVAALNSPLAQGYPTFDAHTQTLYFERDDGIGGTELAFATRPTPFQPFGAPAVVGELAMQGGKNGDPEVSANGKEMVFASERPGSELIDLYRATRSCL